MLGTMVGSLVACEKTRVTPVQKRRARATKWPQMHYYYYTLLTLDESYTYPYCRKTRIWTEHSLKYLAVRVEHLGSLCSTDSFTYDNVVSSWPNETIYKIGQLFVRPTNNISAIFTT